MRRLKLTQGVIAQRAGITQATLSRTLNELTSPDLDTLFALAKALDCSAWELIKPENAESTEDRTQELLNKSIEEKLELLKQLKTYNELLRSPVKRELFDILSTLDDTKVGGYLDLIKGALYLEREQEALKISKKGK